MGVPVFTRQSRLIASWTLLKHCELPSETQTLGAYKCSKCWSTSNVSSWFIMEFPDDLSGTV